MVKSAWPLELSNLPAITKTSVDPLPLVKEMQPGVPSAEAKAFASVDDNVRRRPGKKFRAAASHVNKTIRTQILNHLHLTFDPGVIATSATQVLGADAYSQGLACVLSPVFRQNPRQIDCQTWALKDGPFLIHSTLEEIHWRAPDKTGHERVRGLVVDSRGRTKLLNSSFMEHDDLFSEGHRLGLIVGNVKNGRPQLPVKTRQLHPHTGPERGVEIGERLVKKKYLRLADNRAAYGHPLSLAAAQFLRLPLQLPFDLQEAGRLTDSLPNFSFRQAPQAQGEGHVLVDVHVGIQGIALKDKGYVSLLRRQVVNALAVERDRSAGGLFQPGDKPEKGGLAAARGPQQYAELPIVHFERDLFEHFRGAERFRKLLYRERSDG